MKKLIVISALCLAALTSCSGSGGNPYTYAGGYGAAAAGAGYGGQIELGGTVTVKGQDIQIALDNYNANKRR